MADATDTTIAPKRSRRSVLKLAGSAVVAGYVAGKAISGGDPNPFSTLLQKYHEGMRAYMAIPEDALRNNEGAYAAATYEPHYHAILFEWDEPIQSRVDAIAAIRASVDDDLAGLFPDTKERLSELALAYFEQNA